MRHEVECGHQRVYTQRQTNLHAVANVFARGGKRTYTRSQTSLYAEANELTRGQVCVYTIRQTRLHAEANELTRDRECVYMLRQTSLQAFANTFARGSERDCTRSQTHSSYTLHLSSTVCIVTIQNGVTALYIASLDHVTVVRVLLEKGADFNICDKVLMDFASCTCIYHTHSAFCCQCAPYNYSLASQTLLQGERVWSNCYSRVVPMKTYFGCEKWVLPRARRARTRAYACRSSMPVDRAACCAHERVLSENSKGYVRTHELRLGGCLFLWRGWRDFPWPVGNETNTATPVTNAFIASICLS